jgi:hypothetical protein
MIQVIRQPNRYLLNCHLDTFDQLQYPLSTVLYPKAIMAYLVTRSSQTAPSALHSLLTLLLNRSKTGQSVGH